MRSFDAARHPDEEEIPSSRPLLLIDKNGQIDWAVAGTCEAAQGRHCWEVLGCGAGSRRDCKAVRWLQPGRPAVRRDKSVAASTYPTDTCLISSMPLPFKGLLVWGPKDRGGASARTVLHVVSNLAGTILSRDLAHGGEIVLELIRIAAAAEDSELFLADLNGKELLLNACVGPDRDALLKRTRFEAEEGLPGLAFAQGRPVSTRNLQPEDRFFRRDAAEPEIRSFVSVPIPAPDGSVIGCLNLAWHRSDVAVEALAEALWLAMAPLGNAICAAYWTLRQGVVKAHSDGTAQPLVSMLGALHEQSRADAGSLVLWDERTRKVRQTSFFGAAPPSCPWLASPEASPCSSRNNESGFRLIGLTKPDDAWPEPCRQIRFDGEAVCCIPLVGQPARSGRLLLGFRHNPPDSATAVLVPLQVMAEQIGMQLPEDTPPTASITVEQPALPALQIRCFGRFEVAIGEQKLESSAFQRRDALTLLKMLVLRAGKQLHRARLIEWLWPDADERAGVNRLHGVVHALRAVIEPHAAERRWKHLLNEGDTYSFCPSESTSVDLISFQDYLALARRDLREGAFAPHITHYLEQAVELYRGDLYEDDQYCDWCDVERVALQREFVDALANLARIYLTLGEARRAIYALRRALGHDPSREDLHHELIRCLIRLRRHKEAKEQICECVRHLREELGVQPSTETQRLYHSLVTTGGR